MPAIIGDEKTGEKTHFKIIHPDLNKEYKFDSQIVDPPKAQTALKELEEMDCDEHWNSTNDVAPGLVKQAMTELIDEQLIANERNRWATMRHAREQAALRKPGADMRFLCSIDPAAFDAGLQTDPYYWDDEKELRRYISENNYMTGE